VRFIKSLALDRDHPPNLPCGGPSRMRFWWVNQNQTFAQETAGGYLWSPKRSKNGARNPFYEFMREVAPGDLVLSFEGAHIRAIGVARSYAPTSARNLRSFSRSTHALIHIRSRAYLGNDRALEKEGLPIRWNVQEGPRVQMPSGRRLQT
jgi:hypothetical protein